MCQGEKAAGALGEVEDAGLHLGSTIVDAGESGDDELAEEVVCALREEEDAGLHLGSTNQCGCWLEDEWRRG